MTIQEHQKLYRKFLAGSDGTIYANPDYSPTPEMIERDRKEWEEQKAHRKALEIARASAPQATYGCYETRALLDEARFPWSQVFLALCLVGIFAAMWMCH